MWQYRPTIQHAEFNTELRKQLAAKGQAMPDGGYPIRNVADLKNAIQAYGRATNKPAVKAWIKKRAKALGAEDLLPDNWRTDEIMHYGIKGQKWGVRRTDAQLGHVSNSSRSSRRTGSSQSSPKTSDKKKKPVNKATVRDNIKKGKQYLDNFMRTPAGRILKGTAIAGLAAVGVPSVLLSVANYAMFGQSPLRTLGLDNMDAAYESQRGIHWIEDD